VLISPGGGIGLQPKAQPSALRWPPSLPCRARQQRGAMRPRKTGGKLHSRSSPQKKGRDPRGPDSVPTWPRLDLLSPEHVLDGLYNLGRVILTRENGKSKYLNASDRAVVQHTVRQLRSAEPELFGLLGRMRDAALARELLHRIAAIAKAAYVVGAHGAMADTAERYFKASKAAHMRFQRPNSKREQAIREAIETAVRGERPTLLDYPFKTGDLLLAPVNENLRARGYKGISLRTLHRRLKKRSTRKE
jgi:hypothetical protein